MADDYITQMPVENRNKYGEDQFGDNIFDDIDPADLAAYLSGGKSLPQSDPEPQEQSEVDETVL